MKKITLKQNGTFEHQWINGLHEIPPAAIYVTDDVFMDLSQNPDGKKYDPETKRVSNYVPEFVTANAVIEKQSEITAGFLSAINFLTSQYTSAEISSFGVQEDEAVAWTADNLAPTPSIDLIVANRPSVDKAELVSRIIDNAAAYKSIVFNAMGKKQAYEDRLYALTKTANQSKFDAIKVEF